MNENKLASMDAVGELPDFGNLLLREGGFPHLPGSMWFDATTLPGKPGVYETEGEAWHRGYQYFDGKAWGVAVADKNDALPGNPGSEYFQTQKWREVQP